MPAVPSCFRLGEYIFLTISVLFSCTVSSSSELEYKFGTVSLKNFLSVDPEDWLELWLEDLESSFDFEDPCDVLECGTVPDAGLECEEEAEDLESASDSSDEDFDFELGASDDAFIDVSEDDLEFESDASDEFDDLEDGLVEDDDTEDCLCKLDLCFLDLDLSWLRLDFSLCLFPEDSIIVVVLVMGAVLGNADTKGAWGFSGCALEGDTFGDGGTEWCELDGGDFSVEKYDGDLDWGRNIDGDFDWDNSDSGDFEGEFDEGVIKWGKLDGGDFDWYKYDDGDFDDIRDSGDFDATSLQTLFNFKAASWKADESTMCTCFLFLSLTKFKEKLSASAFSL